jgi:hypothetical protein
MTPSLFLYQFRMGVWFIGEMITLHLHTKHYLDTKQELHLHTRHHQLK